MTLKINELKRAIFQATENAALKLFSCDESFYYFSLITSGEAHAPVISAWSYEKLELFPENERQIIKWSYADSPYFEFGSEYFEDVRRLFSNRPAISASNESKDRDEYNLRLLAMEEAMAELDSKGIFGVGSKRDRIVINVEVMPPDYTNTERARRLNPSSALKNWLNEAAEKSPNSL